MTTNIHLGFAVGSGDPVLIPLKHLAVVGQTQESGKTTTLEALATRSGQRVLAFVTKRGEGSFERARRIAPYFRDRADWQFVDQLLEAQLREKNKFLRPWVIKLCRTTKTLADVHAAVKKQLKKAKGISEGAYTQLDAYLELIVPEIGRATLAPRLDLGSGLAGLNVMDVSAYSTPMQMLFVQSAIDWVNVYERDVITVVPESWEFIPEGRGSPVKASAETLVRKGAGLGNYIWCDSQDMAGVAKLILRGCSVWLIGAQREANEIKRNLSNIPAGIKRPKPEEIAHLKRGQFFACWQDRTVLTYVQPAWMTPEAAKDVALGHKPLPLGRYVPPSRAFVKGCEPMGVPNTPKEDAMNDFQSRMERVLPALERMTGVAGPGEYVPPGLRPGPAFSPVEAMPETVVRREDVRLASSLTGDEEAVYQRFKARLIQEAATEPAILKILTNRPELLVEVEKITVTADGNSLRGRVARLIANGFFDEVVTASAAYTELVRQGFKCAKPGVYKECDNLAGMGLLTKEKAGYKVAPGAKVNIVKK